MMPMPSSQPEIVLGEDSVQTMNSVPSVPGLSPPPPAPKPPAEAPSVSTQWFVSNEDAATRAMMMNNHVIPPPENKEGIEKTRFEYVVSIAAVVTILII